MNTYKTRDITPPTLHQLAKSLRYMNKPIMADVADEAGEHLAALEAENAKLRAALEKIAQSERWEGAIAINALKEETHE